MEQIKALQKRVSSLENMTALLRRFAPDHCSADNYHQCINIDERYISRNGAPRILCMVLLTKKEHTTALTIKKTWGAKCDSLVFLSDHDDPALPAVNMHAKWEGTADSLIDKMFKGWQYVNAARQNGTLTFDWVLKLDTDSMPIMENVRRMLVAQYERFQHHWPIYIGRRQKYYGREDAYYNAGAGYMLNSLAVELAVCAIKGAAQCATTTGGKAKVYKRVVWNEASREYDELEAVQASGLQV
jgi:hypothetical protein